MLEVRISPTSAHDRSEDARDHDDAVWVERAGDGYRATIAIADVSSYVRPGTHLDREAIARGCSVYLPDRAIPMLPRPLSSNLCSLLPGVIRLCLAVEVELDGGGHVRRSRLIRGFIKSAAKLTYGNVARALGFSDAAPRDPQAEAMVDGLRVAYELSRKLRTRRLKRGAVDFDLPEAKIQLGEDGKPLDIQRRAEDAGVKRAYQLIEELMLLANEVVAGWFTGKKLPAVYRVHAPPRGSCASPTSASSASSSTPTWPETRSSSRGSCAPSPTTRRRACSTCSSCAR